MINYLVYDGDGRILKTGVCQKQTIHLQSSEGCFAMEGDGDELQHYVKDGKVTPRPLFDVAIDGLTITGVPSNTSVYIDGELAGQCDTGGITIEKENPIDNVTVRLSLFPYIDKETTL